MSAPVKVDSGGINTAERFARHVLALSPDTLPGAAMAAAKTFLLDTLGVGMAGAHAPYASEVLKVALQWGGADTAAPAPVLGRNLRLPPHCAAFLNAFQIHSQEFDCVHEAAVVHPLATIVSALMADTARLAPVDGRTFLVALIGAVDVAAGLGLAAKTPLKFFRPATAGIFGCIAGMARLRRLDVPTTMSAFGHALAFASGTMQAHVEGLPGLALQIAHATRNALMAVDLAVAGIPGVSRSIDGPFGYLSLFEDASDPSAVLADLGHVFRITEVSHKPFPTGRAAHGGLAAIQTLLAEHALTASNLEHLVYTAPPLIHRLVGRPIHSALTPSYARLCFPYLGAVALLRGTVGLADFTQESLENAAVHTLAARIEVVPDGNPDPAAFVPATARARFRDGRVVTVSVHAQLGSPALPLTRQLQLAKFRTCAAFGYGAGHSDGANDTLIEWIEAIENEPDVARIWEQTGASSLPPVSRRAPCRSIP